MIIIIATTLTFVMFCVFVRYFVTHVDESANVAEKQGEAAQKELENNQ